MKIKEVREMSEKDLRERIETEKASLDQMHMNNGVSPLENSSQFSKVRKDIARMFTVLGEIEKQNKK
ncbi:MAG: 50S ribosomal protein L29 [Bacteroidales bacterium]|jgi:large subunit ribosomal protein L29|nr:50S ribosomal protein L29 [Bacteroidales bacterium]